MSAPYIDTVLNITKYEVAKAELEAKEPENAEEVIQKAIAERKEKSDDSGGV